LRSVVHLFRWKLRDPGYRRRVQVWNQPLRSQWVGGTTPKHVGRLSIAAGNRGRYGNLPYLMRFMLPLIGWTNFHRNAYTTLRSPRVMLRLSRFQTLLVAPRHRRNACPKARRTSARQHRTEPHPADPPFCAYGPNRYNIHNLQDTRMLAVRRCTADIAACITHQEGQK